jgi:hypothetical protein
MTLNEWSAITKRTLYDDLSKGLTPSAGEFDDALLNEARSKGRPQMGATVYSPGSARFEFVYKDHIATTVFSVTVPAPERIVFLPVPAWVIETIWQGDVDGSYHFQSEADTLVESFLAQLGPDSNPRLFGRKEPTRRE